MDDFLEYFTVDKLTSIGLFILKPLLILIVCKIIINVLLNIASRIFDKTKLDDSIKHFVRSAIKVLLWVLVVIFIAESLGVNTASLVTILGVISLAFSLSLQSIITNVFSGILVLMTKPFSVGDFVEVAGVSGTVKSIKLLRTTLITPDNKIELIPNSDIESAKVINYSSEELRRVDLTVCAAYTSSTESVKKAILDVLNSDDRVKKDKEHEPFIKISGYNSNDIEYTIRVWVDNVNYWGVYFDTLENIRASFDKNGVEFSYPHVVVHQSKN